MSNNITLEMREKIRCALVLPRRLAVACALHPRSNSPLAMIADLLPKIMSMDVHEVIIPKALNLFRPNRNFSSATDWHVDIETFRDMSHMEEVKSVFDIIEVLVHPHVLQPSDTWGSRVRSDDENYLSGDKDQPNDCPSPVVLESHGSNEDQPGDCWPPVVLESHGRGGDENCMDGYYYWPPVRNSANWSRVEFYTAGPFSILSGVIDYVEETFTGSRSQFDASVRRISICRMSQE